MLNLNDETLVKRRAKNSFKFKFIDTHHKYGASGPSRIELMLNILTQHTKSRKRGILLAPGAHMNEPAGN